MNTFLFNLINGNRAPLLDILSTIISSYLFLGLLVFGIMLYIILSPRVIHKTRTIVFIILAILLNLFFVNLISKNFILSPRPYLVLPNVHTLGIIKTDSTIPSSHVSMMTSILLALVINNPFLWPTLVFILVVGWSRVYNGMHWPVDIVLGIIAGIVSV